MAEGVVWDIGPAVVVRHMEEMAGRINAIITTSVDYFATRVETEAKTNAPWTDRTGNARNGLKTQAFHKPEEHVIVLFHQVPYGIFLEVCNDGKYAIVEPTIKKNADELMKTMGRLFERLGVE